MQTQDPIPNQPKAVFKHWLVVLATALAAALAASLGWLKYPAHQQNLHPPPDQALVHANANPHPRWFKGNLHTHTWWSDGDSPPEIAAQWYADHGYNFLLFTDHNTVLEGDRWISPEGTRRKTAEAAYEKHFAKTIKKRRKNGKIEYKLKTMSELKEMFDRPDRFVLLQGEEITARVKGLPVHLNAFHLPRAIAPRVGATVLDTLQNNLDAISIQRSLTGQPLLAFINHPNFGWALGADDIAPIENARFFEVYNGHRNTYNEGGGEHLSTDRLWDTILARRMAQLHLPVVYGIATDDAHMYVQFPRPANPGRGWVMVLSNSLSPLDLAAAMEKGAFYATTGVVLKHIEMKNGTLRLEIKGKESVSHTTRFIGTLKGDASVANGVGQVLAEQSGTSASYTFLGNELYVRAKVVSNSLHPNPSTEGEMETAWIEPVTRDSSFVLQEEGP